MGGSLGRKIFAALMLAAAAFMAACGQQDAGPVESPGGTAVHADSGTSSGAAAQPPSASTAAESTSPGASGSSSPSAGASEESGPTAGQTRTQPESGPSPPDPSPAANPSPSAARPSAATSPPAASAPSSPEADEEAARTVTISIVGNAEWGTIVAPEQTALEEGETAAELLIRTLKAHRLAYETRGSGALFYVEGIDGLFEFDDGPTSGWKFRVNGETLGIGAGAAELKPGDTVEWIYVSKDEDAEKDGGLAP